MGRTDRAFKNRAAQYRPDMHLLVGADRVALSGHLGEIRRHAHATAAVVVGLDRPLRFVADDRSRESRAALLAPGFSHAVEVRGSRVAVFLLPAVAARAPLRDLHPGTWLELADHVGRLDDFEPIDRALAREVAAPIDDRLAEVIEQMAERLDQNVPLDELAAGVRLSAARLMTLAREQLGVPLREYRRWLRTFRVARQYAAGASLTGAALDAGFSSSAHLSVAARAHFGIRPSQVLSPANRSRIVHARRPASA